MARVVILAGPSGSGKSHLAERVGWPILRLDDFYKDGDDSTLPRTDLGGGSTIVDWDDPRSWNHAAAMAAIRQLCATGATEIPTYDIATSRRTGAHRLDLAGAEHFIAEGIFAQEVVAECRELGLLAEAFCITQNPLLTFARRLSRDLAEHRKPPWVLLRRGIHLLRKQAEIVADARRLGCVVASPSVARVAIESL